MRTIIARFEVEDNDLIEYKLEQSLKSLGYKDYKVLPNTDEYWDNDENFRKLAKAKSDASRKLETYINKLKLKK